jgi:hypothetical protein
MNMMRYEYEWVFKEIYLDLLHDTSPNLPQHCPSLEDELDHVKLEIVNMMSVKDASNKEIQTLQKYEVKISEFEEENDKLKQSLKGLEHSLKTDPKPYEKVSIPDILVATSSFVDLITHTVRTSPDGQEVDDQCLIQLCQAVGGNICKLNDLEEKVNKLKSVVLSWRGKKSNCLKIMIKL